MKCPKSQRLGLQKGDDSARLVIALVAGGDDLYGVEQVKVDAIAILYFAPLRHDSIIHVSFLLFLSRVFAKIGG